MNLSAKRNASDALDGEIQSFEQYESGYHRLARHLGRGDKVPPDGEVELIRKIVRRRRGLQGSLTVPDSLFLAACVSILAPKRTLDVGTAAGFSAALLAAIMRQRSYGATTPCVDSIDTNTRYFADEELVVGWEIKDLIPEYPEAVRVHAPRESDFVQDLAKPGELRMVFIDGNHAHPYPLLDLLRIAPYLQPEGWIVLHDVLLGTLALEARAKGSQALLPEFGAEWLFQNWPFPKIKGGNIGAIQLPHRKRVLEPAVQTLMKLPFETPQEIDRDLRSEVERCFDLL
jgi:predicted O-methyltransferase YrrM